MLKKIKSKKWKIWKPEKIEKNHNSEINKKNRYFSSLNQFTNSKIELLDLKKINNEEENLNKFKEIYKSGFENGKKEGIKLEKKNKEKIFQEKQMFNDKKMESILHSLKLSLKKLDNQIASSVLNIIMKMSIKIFGGKPTLNTLFLFKKIEKIVNEELQGYKTLQFHVHKNDLKFIQKKLQDTINKNGWKILISNHIDPGECQITSNAGDFYISANKSWKILCKKILNEEKE